MRIQIDESEFHGRVLLEEDPYKILKWVIGELFKCCKPVDVEEAVLDLAYETDVIREWSEKMTEPLPANMKL